MAGAGRRGCGHNRGSDRQHSACSKGPRRSLGARPDDRAGHAVVARPAPLLRGQPEHGPNPREFRGCDERSRAAVLGRRTPHHDGWRGGGSACRTCAGAKSDIGRLEEDDAVRLLRDRHGADAPRNSMARNACRPAAVPRLMMLDALSGLFRSWASEVETLAWLALALAAAIVEVSIPHFGFAF